eukprot:Plantae.Rhodophyta-Hildenbrandia_rubra.ctg31427.p1 GENE.Plantae.Rhodophyta-Hildenbrandia_rubra.ctg31427~~Plantae.Rhodophyta-Hildenbrandia_rubra.ctg31427.p1  ORF type:complete len:310 (+),score=68.01 Plantae.Rhodophyta-Hildenbrandia_rubra.ctg31427:379-1308(+)
MATVKLSSGCVMPLNGFGTWRSEPGVVADALRTALECGYRHIDCAAIYMNEKEIGSVFEEYFRGDSPKMKREDVFVTSKVWNSCHAKDKVVEACKQTLKDLKLDYLDMYLVHFPISWEFKGLPIKEENWISRDDEGHVRFTNNVTLQDTWKGMEECVRLGLVKTIGVSNFPVFVICDMLNYCEIKPAVNQCECHAMNQKKDLRGVCDEFGIHFTAYSVLGSGKTGPLQNETVMKIADKKGVSPAQICIAWTLSLGISCLAKSTKDERIKANFTAEKIKLSKDELAELDKIDEGLIVCNPLEYWNFAALA